LSLSSARDELGIVASIIMVSAIPASGERFVAASGRKHQLLSVASARIAMTGSLKKIGKLLDRGQDGRLYNTRQWEYGNARSIFSGDGLFSVPASLSNLTAIRRGFFTRRHFDTPEQE
jgi:hypothetical protein